MGAGHTHKGNTLNSLVNHNVGTNGGGEKKKGEEEWEKGEATLCMTSLLTTGLRGTSSCLTQDVCHTRIYRHAPIILPLKLWRKECGLEKRGLKTPKKLWMIIDRKIAVCGFSRLQRSLKSLEKCSKTKWATKNSDRWLGQGVFFVSKDEKFSLWERIVISAKSKQTMIVYWLKGQCRGSELECDAHCVEVHFEHGYKFVALWWLLSHTDGK